MEIGSDSAEYELVAYFPRQFEALRIAYCATFNEFIISMSKSYEWQNVSGGKSKATFSKSIDQKYILKYVSKSEFKMFIDNCNQYFHHNAKYLFHKMPSAMAKIVGAFKIIKKSSNKNIEKIYCVVMENLSYNLLKPNINLKIYDLKGSRLNRYMKNKDKVLLDTNFREDFNGEPLVLDSDIYSLLRSAIINDSLLLSKMNVVDYSLLVIILNEDGKEDTDVKKIKFGIRDYFRKYTWDKQLETRFKKLINNFKDPTIISPENYKKRFDEKISRYFIGT
jgi:1-phosphatidylinositol-3-phosphate 5-kinase